MRITDIGSAGASPSRVGGGFDKLSHHVGAASSAPTTMGSAQFNWWQGIACLPRGETPAPPIDYCFDKLSYRESRKSYGSAGASPSRVGGGFDKLSYRESRK